MQKQVYELKISFHNILEPAVNARSKTQCPSDIKHKLTQKNKV